MICTVPLTFNGLVKFADKAVFDSEATFNDSIHTEGDHTISGNLEVGKDAEVDGKLTLNTLGDLKTKDESFLAETSEDNGKIIHEVGLKDVGTTISANTDQSEVTWSVNNANLVITANKITVPSLSQNVINIYREQNPNYYIRLVSPNTSTTAYGSIELHRYYNNRDTVLKFGETNNGNMGIVLARVPNDFFIITANTTYKFINESTYNSEPKIVATREWVQSQSYLTSASLDNYVTKDSLTTTLADYAKTTYIASTYATKDDLTNKIADVTAITNELDSKIETNYNSINNLTSHAITATATDIKATLVFTIINVVNKSYAGTVLIDILKDLFNTYAKAGNKLPYVISCSGVFIGSEIIFITSITLPEDFADSGMITITGYNPSGAEVTQTVSAAVFTSVTDTISFPTVG